jgi:transglutaminase-like putative cysteine protease
MLAAPCRLLVALAVVWLVGCQSLYFEGAGQAPQPAPQYKLASWPDREYWAGIVFNGEKIGFSHLALAPAREVPGAYEIRSESAFVLRFAGFEKKVNLKSFDLVDENLALQRFSYDYSIDGNTLALFGARHGDLLDVVVKRETTEDRQSLPLRGPVYPQSAIDLYPSLQGLAAGRTYRYPVYSGELQAIAEVTQRIEGYERSKLFDGEAFRIETAMQGSRVQTWINARAQPMLEIAMNGVLISGREDERRATSYLAAASLSKSETFIDFAIVRPARPLERPREITSMKVAVWGADATVPSDSIQSCSRNDTETVCEIHPIGTTSSASAASLDPRYLASTFPVPARNPAIAARANEIVVGHSDRRERIDLLVAWLTKNVVKSPVDVWNALDVLEKREAECQGHTYLYTAFARSLEIPTRVVNGIVYSEDFQGFLYHTWAESWVDGRWIAVDPTFGMVPADATHLKLVEGETPVELTPLVAWIGQLKLRVIEASR